VRAILIDPTARSCDEIDLPDFIAGIRKHFGGAKLVRVAIMPKGDRVHIVQADDDEPHTFTLGGSGPHRGLGLVLGPRGLFGMVKNSRTRIDGLTAILSFGSQPMPTRSNADHGYAN
jgi:hypothetical protein